MQQGYYIAVMQLLHVIAAVASAVTSAVTSPPVGVQEAALSGLADPL